jgi:hypothetical protein
MYQRDERFTGPFTLKSVRAASYGLRSYTNETAVAELVDSKGRFVAAGGFEGLVIRADKERWSIENEAEARYLAAQYGGRL